MTTPAFSGPLLGPSASPTESHCRLFSILPPYPGPFHSPFRLLLAVCSAGDIRRARLDLRPGISSENFPCFALNLGDIWYQLVGIYLRPPYRSLVNADRCFQVGMNDPWSLGVTVPTCFFCHQVVVVHLARVAVADLVPLRLPFREVAGGFRVIGGRCFDCCRL